jgi:hypothetical protein
MFHEERDHLMRPDNIAAFFAAQGWLKANTNPRAPTGTVFSYGLEQLIGPEVGRMGAGVCMTNGLCIAAALAEGCPVKRGLPGESAASIDAKLTQEAWERSSRARRWSVTLAHEREIGRDRPSCRPRPRPAGQQPAPRRAKA